MRSYLFVCLLFVWVLWGCDDTPNGNAKASLIQSSPPRQVVLTWQQDPSTTMTITWRTDDLPGRPFLRVSDRPDARRSWSIHEPVTYRFEQSPGWIHTVELTGLIPGYEYFVVIDHPDQPQDFSFRTIPDGVGREDLVFLAGGDSRSRRDVRREMNRLAAQQEPHFVLFDGDFINTPLSEEQWDEWFDDWHELLITPSGRRIPVVPAIGNHEVDGGYLQTPDQAPYFFNRLITPGRSSYYVLEFGPQMALITLDSDHTATVEVQVPWLDSVLQAHHDTRWKIVQYHVAAWPSVRDFNGDIPKKIRKHWVPLMEKYGVNLVVEAHDHAFKRTVPIRNQQRDDVHGIVYIGDGGWGAPLRETRNAKDFWWLEDAFPADHFWRITLAADASSLKVEPVFRPQSAPFILKASPELVTQPENP
ncbi:MAG: purple acid phosphatase family protein [Bacteroidales bacterium]